MGKHVIFLGAGASATSRYPVAQELRKEWFVSAQELEARTLKAAIDGGGLDHHVELKAFFENWIVPIDGPLQLFRKGCFGTIDEFCKLIRDKRAPEVVYLKKVIRLVLGLQQPEAEWTKSDYYPFIQRLFADDLYSLRNDVVVLSFNYDVYLEWLLRRAFKTRVQAYEHDPAKAASLILDADPAITSGFSGWANGLSQLSAGTGFCILKLHGMIAWPEVYQGTVVDPPDITFEQVFDRDIAQRVSALLKPHGERGIPPIVFPWEIFAKDGGFINEADFKHPDKADAMGSRDGNRDANAPSLFKIFEAIWLRARKEVQEASKISFVGLSMHQYLDQGFRFLFQPEKPKQREVELVVTDRASGIASGEYGKQMDLPPHCSSSRVLRLLMVADHTLRCNVAATGSISSARIRHDFSEFIEKEM